jgi:outer membrane receptor for ferrienterochelin and colicins
MLFSFSYTDHDQNSVYGDMPYMAKQRMVLVIDLGLNKHDLGLLCVINMTTTPATVEEDIN